MLIAVAGIPVGHFNRFQQQSGVLAGRGHVMIGVNARAQGGVQKLDADDAEKLAARVNALLGKEPAKAEGGLGVIYLAHPWIDTTAFEAHLHPAVIGLRVDLPAPVVTDGTEGRIYINALLAGIAANVPWIVRAVAAVRSELTSRRNRTPLLLPLRNFASDLLEPSIGRLARDLPTAEAPHDRLLAACKEIEALHPYQARGPDKGFVDDTEIVFRSPGRDLHGGIWANAGEGHNVRCSLNGRFRLGGPIAPGFHFDCVRGDRLTGDFRNCHDARAAYRGDPHLNIAPNDFVRS